MLNNLNMNAIKNHYVKGIYRGDFVLEKHQKVVWLMGKNSCNELGTMNGEQNVKMGFYSFLNYTNVYLDYELWKASKKDEQKGILSILHLN